MVQVSPYTNRCPVKRSSDVEASNAEAEAEEKKMAEEIQASIKKKLTKVQIRKKRLYIGRFCFIFWQSSTFLDRSVKLYDVTAKYFLKALYFVKDFFV